MLCSSFSLLGHLKWTSIFPFFLTGTHKIVGDRSPNNGQKDSLYLTARKCVKVFCRRIFLVPALPVLSGHPLYALQGDLAQTLVVTTNHFHAQGPQLSLSQALPRIYPFLGLVLIILWEYAQLISEKTFPIISDGHKAPWGSW